MRKLITLFALLFGLIAQAQKETYTYFIKFRDKNNSIFDIKKPELFLSNKAILRRAKFQIKIDETDLPVNESYIRAVCSRKVKFKNSSKWLNGILVEVEDTNALLRITDNTYVAYALCVAKYSKQAKVSAELNAEIGGEPIDVFGENVENSKSSRQNIYGKAFDQIKMLQGTALHQKKLTGNGVTIAVLDAGYFNANKLPWFINLQKNHQILGMHDFVDNDTLVFDASDHGLEVLSCMAMVDSGTYIGTAPLAQYLLLRSEDAETEQLVEEINWSVAAEYADSIGVDLITTSLGYNTFDDLNMNHSPSDLDGATSFVTMAAELAFSKGIVVVCSAGNDGAKAWRKIGFPGDAHHAITVGAVNLDRAIADFSSTGPTADGVSKPDITALGVSSAVASPFGGVSYADGTSFATPITAGLVACLIQEHPAKTPQEIADAVRWSADRAEIADTFYGMGIPDFNLANFILGDSTYDRTKDNLFNITYNKADHLFCFTIYSATTQVFGFKLIDDNGNILKTGSQQCIGRKFKHFYIDEMELPEMTKRYGFIVENEAHQTFIKLF